MGHRNSLPERNRAGFMATGSTAYSIEPQISSVPEAAEAAAAASSSAAGSDPENIDWTVLDRANSRKYHSVETSIYMLPEEEFEQRRLLLQNRILAMSFDGHILTPEIRQSPEKSRAILDVGCANGIWLESVFFAGFVSSSFHGVMSDTT
ncbi:hypothetical protein HDU83_009960 [Entophlyctis luteolus]|nr:hypothetical protein HDU83_009960 [Entophlyctis luteolus]KAJ3386672.1 hypothetical protein HDU84_001362 [Entophlyctis sp. JEL0112]